MINTNNPFDSESEEREMKVDLVVDFIENLRQR
jgi:hypothetical protein